MNNEPIAAFLPDFCEDLSIYTSIASRYITIAGAVGQGNLTTPGNKCFHSKNHKHYNGHFYFYNNANDLDMDTAQKYACNFSVVKQQPIKRFFAPLKLLHQNPGKDDPDNNQSPEPKSTPSPSTPHCAQSSPKGIQNLVHSEDRPRNTSYQNLSKWFVSVNKNTLVQAL